MSSFTGERPGWGKDFDYDESRHLAAYIFAREHVRGLDVMDAGCGEGFGTCTLANFARSVIGVDYSGAAISACEDHWNASNLGFYKLDLTNPGDFQQIFDVILNFQVIEHIEDPLPFLEGMKRRLRPGGTLIITTPNRLSSFSENPYHVREYVADELAALLRQVFRKVEILGMRGNERVLEFDRGRERAVNRILRLDPLGLRNMLPPSVVNFAFAKLAVVVRRSAKKGVGSESIVPEDFRVERGDVESALDLVALCNP